METGVNLQRLLLRAYNNPAALSFHELHRLVEAYGFRLARVNGSHHIYAREGTAQLVNLQSVKGNAKPYQVRQFLQLVERLGLSMETDQ
jgi:predicted RNA binding protein YcfA (HicA-like mRNA interferase family)